MIVKTRSRRLSVSFSRCRLKKNSRDLESVLYLNVVITFVVLLEIMLHTVWVKLMNDRVVHSPLCFHLGDSFSR